MIRKMTEEEAEKFCEERCTFLDYKDIQEYMSGIRSSERASSWRRRMSLS